MKRKNSWIRQLGILNILGIPILLHGEKMEVVLATLVAAALSFLGLPLLIKCNRKMKLENDCRNTPGVFIRRLVLVCFQFMGMVLALGAMIAVAWWYSEKSSWLWLLGAMGVITLLVGRKRGEQGRDSMIRIWEKVLGVSLFLLLVFQIPYTEFSYIHTEFTLPGTTATGGVFSNMEWWKVFAMGVGIFGVNLPFYLVPLYGEPLGDSGKEELLFSHGILWGIFLLTVLIVVGMWEIPVLKQAAYPFMLLGQTGTGYRGENVRLEALCFLIVIVLLYFSAGACLDGWHALMRGKEKNKPRKEVGFVVAAGALAVLLCTGCAPRLAEQQFVLIGDEEQLISAEENVKISSMKMLVIHSQDLGELVPHVLKHPNLSLSIPVVYSKEAVYQPLEEIMEGMGAQDTMSYVEELAERGTKISPGEYVTVREVLNAWATGRTLQLPVVEIREQELEITGSVWYKDGFFYYMNVRID